MVYATAEQVREVLHGDPFLKSNTAAVLTDDTIESQIASASAEVDARLSNRYAVPLSPTPALVLGVVVDVAAYLCTLTYRRAKDLTDQDPVVLRYNRARQILADLALGVADLPGVDDGTVVETGGTMHVVNPYEGHLFSLRDLGLGYSGRRISPWE